jgi:Fe2+ or Zn2+ uptake regulation protein
MDPVQRFREFLAAKGRPLTAQGVVVVEVAFTLSGTFDEDDVCARLAGRVSRATVYRTLGKLVQADLLRRVQFNGRQVLVATAEPDGEIADR